MGDPSEGADRPFVRLSDLLRRPVRSASGRSLGRLTDLVVSADEQRPVVRELVVHSASDVALPWSAVGTIDGGDIGLVDGDEPGPTGRPLAATDLQLARDVLDAQIVDLHGHRLVRVSDVVLVADGDELAVLGVDTGFGAVLRRLGFRRIGDRLRPEVVLWGGIHLTSRRGHAAHLALRSAHLQRLSPDDLAHLLSRLTVHHATDVLDQSPTDSAADALAHSPDEVGRRLLAALPEERSHELLEAMPATRAHRLRHLLRRAPLPRRRYHRTRGWTRDAPRPDDEPVG